jgi:hypothetical protein
MRSDWAWPAAFLGAAFLTFLGAVLIAAPPEVARELLAGLGAVAGGLCFVLFIWVIRP